MIYDTVPYKNACYIYADEIDDLLKSNSGIHNLARQIINECCYDNGDKWGNIDERTFSNSTSLLLRISSVLSDDSFRKMFGFKLSGDETDIIEAINAFLQDNSKSVLRVGFESVPFNFQAREILTNTFTCLVLWRLINSKQLLQWLNKKQNLVSVNLIYGGTVFKPILCL